MWTWSDGSPKRSTTARRIPKSASPRSPNRSDSHSRPRSSFPRRWTRRLRHLSPLSIVHSLRLPTRIRLSQKPSHINTAFFIPLACLHSSGSSSISVSLSSIWVVSLLDFGFKVSALKHAFELLQRGSSSLYAPCHPLRVVQRDWKQQLVAREESESRNRAISSLRDSESARSESIEPCRPATLRE